jgi:hypothetical protein
LNRYCGTQGIGSCSDINSLDVEDVKKQFGSGSNVKIRQPGFPELRLDTEIMPLADANQFIIRVQVSLSKKLPLSRSSSYYVMADVWKREPAIRAVSSANLLQTLMDIALEQVRAFISAKSSAQKAGPGQISPEFIESSVEIKTGSVEQKKAESKYVASKNGKVFHKPDCPSAKKILPKNLVTYATRDEAVKAGKRPCERCNP